MKDGSIYYVFATDQGIPVHCSTDMIYWENGENCGRALPVHLACYSLRTFLAFSNNIICRTSSFSSKFPKSFSQRSGCSTG